MVNLKVGACICCFNGEDYLAKSIESILSQNRKPDEIIFVNDGSSDRSGNIMEGFSEHEGVKVIHHAKNLGQGEGFTSVIRNSSADVMCFLDADDVWFPEKTQCVEEAFDNYPEVGIVQNNMEILQGDFPTGHLHFGFMFTGDVFDMWLSRRIFPRLSPTSGLSVRLEVLRAVLPIPKVRHSADSYVMRASIAHTNVHSIMEPLGYYRVHGENQVFGNDEHDPALFFKENIAPALLKHFQDKGFQIPKDVIPDPVSSHFSRWLDISPRIFARGIKRRISKRNA